MRPWCFCAGRHTDIVLSNFWLPGFVAIDLRDVCFQQASKLSSDTQRMCKHLDIWKYCKTSLVCAGSVISVAEPKQVSVCSKQVFTTKHCSYHNGLNCLPFDF